MTPSSEDDYETAAGNNEEVELIQNISKLSGKFSSLQNSFVCLHLARPSGPSHHLGAPQKASRPPHLKRPPGAEDLEKSCFLLPLQHLWTIDNHSLRKASYKQSGRRKSDNLPQFLALNVSETFEPWGWQKDGSDHFRSSAKEKKKALHFTWFTCCSVPAGVITLTTSHQRTTTARGRFGLELFLLLQGF